MTALRRSVSLSKSLQPYGLPSSPDCSFLPLRRYTTFSPSLKKDTAITGCLGSSGSGSRPASFATSMSNAARRKSQSGSPSSSAHALR